MDAKASIGVLGLGYVGIVNVACLSAAGFIVRCNDVKPLKVQRVGEGKSPIIEPKVEELIATGVEEGRIIAMDDAAELVRSSDIIISCVGTPSKADGEVNLDYLRNVMKDIAEVLDESDKKFIVCRSTVPPGTTERLYDRFFGNRYPNVVPVFYPEFLREGSAVSDFHDYGRFVLGHREGDDVSTVMEMLHVNKERPSFLTDLATAEYAKYIDNSFHALKIVFANEIFGLASELGVNVQDSHRIFVADDRLNISKRYLRPGLPFGGSCLPKDVRELQFLIKHSGRDMDLLPSLMPSNDAFVERLYEQVVSNDIGRIGFIGLSFKNHSDDLRESPILRILDKLRADRAYEIRIWDEDLHLQNLRIDFPYLYSLVEDLEGVIRGSDLLIVSKRYLAETNKLKDKDQLVYNWSDDLYETGDNVQSLYA